MFKRFAVFAAAVLVLASCAIPRYSIVRGTGQMACAGYRPSSAAKNEANGAL